MVMNSFDRRGQVWKQWEGGFDTWDKNGNTAYEKYTTEAAIRRLGT
jgi:hypothetical protein